MKSIKKYLITLISGLLGVGFIAWAKDIFNVTEPIMIFHILCDAFFAIGVVITGMGLLIFTTNEGVFDGLVYAVNSFFGMFKRDLDRKYDTLYDYKESRANKKFSFGFMLISGIVFIAISMIMYLMYRRYL